MNLVSNVKGLGNLTSTGKRSLLGPENRLPIIPGSAILIERIYHQRRLYSALGYQRPVQFEEQRARLMVKSAA